MWYLLFAQCHILYAGLLADLAWRQAGAGTSMHGHATAQVGQGKGGAPVATKGGAQNGKQRGIT
jgi:hypothetical protein